MAKHVSVVMKDDLFQKMERERGRESKSSFMNYVLECYFRDKEENNNATQ